MHSAFERRQRSLCIPIAAHISPLKARRRRRRSLSFFCMFAQLAEVIVFVNSLARSIHPFQLSRSRACLVGGRWAFQVLHTRRSLDMFSWAVNKNRRSRLSTTLPACLLARLRMGAAHVGRTVLWCLPCRASNQALTSSLNYAQRA